MGKNLFFSIVTGVALTSLLGCAQPEGRMASAPAGCNINNTVAGAVGGVVIGSGIGVAAGTLLDKKKNSGAAIGGTTGAVVGGLIGTAMGAAADQQCQRWALQVAMDAADRAEAAKSRELAALADKQATVAAAEAKDARLRTAASRNDLQRARQQRDAAAKAAQPNYQRVVWTSSTNQRGGITPLSNATDAATQDISSSKRVCRTIQNDAGIDGSAPTGTARACKNSAGGWDIVS